MGTVDSVVGFGTVLFVAGHTGATAIVGRWDGAAWTTRDVTAELDAVMSPVLRVSGRNESDLDAFYLGGSVLLHFDGATWQRAAILPPIYAAAPIGTSMVVGTASDVYRESTTSYVDVSTTLPATAGLGVVGVWGATCTDVDLVLAGVSTTDPSRIVHFDGSRWVTALDRSMTTITGLSGSSDGAVYAVTFNGDVLRRTAGVWSTIQNLPAQLRGVAAVPGVVTVFGDNGAVFTSSGGAWQNHPRPSDTITGAWVNGVNDVYVVRTGGGSSGVARWDGTAWNEEALPPYPYRNLQAIWGDGNGGLIAVGDHGEALHREVGVWRVDSTMPYDEYRTVSGARSNDVFAVGRFGTVAHWDGAHWAPVRVDVSNPRSVWTTDRCTYFGGEYSMPSLHRMERRDPWQ
jgi:hypothetical protein